MAHLARYFAVSIESYAVMSNHFHLVIHYDPLACQTWSRQEVARRWVLAFPRKGQLGDHLKQELARQALLENPTMLERRRRQLGSLSTFMQQLKQPISYRANQEDKLTGHFFEQRFYSSALLDDSAVVAAMAYVDLNPVRARLTRTLSGCAFTSIRERLNRSKTDPGLRRLPLEPLYSGLSSAAPTSLPDLETYTNHLNSTIASQTSSAARAAPPNEELIGWMSRIAILSRRQRAYGSAASIANWLRARGMRALETAFPA